MRGPRVPDGGQAAQRGLKASPPHRRPPSCVRWRRCDLLVVSGTTAQPAPSQRTQDGGEMGPYHRDLVLGRPGRIRPQLMVKQTERKGS